MPGTLSSGGNILYAWLITPTIAPVSVAANTTAEQTFTIPGLNVNDNVAGYYFGPNVSTSAAQTAGIGIANMRVSAPNTLQIGFSNSTAGGVVPATGLYYLCICRPETWPLPISAA